MMQLCTLNTHFADYLGLPKRSGKLKRLDQFDAEFFGIARNVADDMDSAIRILHEIAYEAILDAGVDPTTLRGSNTGVYIGCCDKDTEWAHREDDSNPTASPQHWVTRLSYAFDLRGPGCYIDTYCASSFSALNEAFRAVRSGVVEQAIVAGLAIHVNPYTSLLYQKNQMTSQEGVSRCLDAAADGYVRSEAAVCVFVQRQQDAKRVYAKILNTCSNADGFKQGGVTYPKQQVQTKLMLETYNGAGVNPLDLTYMEAHLTGTPGELLWECDCFQSRTSL